MMTAGVVAGAASVLGFLGEFHWALDICSHFRVQYFLFFAVSALLLLVPGKRWAAALFGAFAWVNGAVILPLYFGEAPGVSGHPVRAMLANVETGNGNAVAVAEAVRRFNPDILVLEEVNHQWLSDMTGILSRYGYSKQEPREDNFGIALFSRFPIARSEVVCIGEADVPSIIAEIETLQGRCTVLATHPLPPAGRVYSQWRNNQLAEIPGWVHRAASPVLLLGDLNVSPWSPYFRRLLRDSGLRDSARGHGVCPTWPTFNPLMRIPIDHCLYSQGIWIAGRQTGPHVDSDHFPVIVDLVIQSPPIRQESSRPLEASARGGQFAPP